MNLFDTPCHIADPAFDGARADEIARFREVGERRALVVADHCEE